MPVGSSDTRAHSKMPYSRYLGLCAQSGSLWASPTSQSGERAKHNLRDVNVSIPRNTLTVVTGLSVDRASPPSPLTPSTPRASAVTSETLSASTPAKFLHQLERPDVDAIDGLSPAISIEQKTTSRSPRSTVGTITQIYD